MESDGDGADGKPKFRYLIRKRPINDRHSTPVIKGSSKIKPALNFPIDQDVHRLTISRGAFRGPYRSTSTGLASSEDEVSPKLKIKQKLEARQRNEHYEHLLAGSREKVKIKEEQSALSEKKKCQITGLLNQTGKSADQAKGKLREPLISQKRAEDDMGIEKFRATEMEQAGIEKMQKVEEALRGEIAAVKNQHALDVSAPISATQQLENMREEVKIVSDQRNKALARVDDAIQTSEAYAQKVQSLSAECMDLRISFDSKLVRVEEENKKMVAELFSQIGALAAELEIANGFKKKYEEMEASMAELKATVEGKDLLLQKGESEICSLGQKVMSLEITVGRYKDDIAESEGRLLVSEELASKMAAMVLRLEHEMEILKEENSQFSSNVERLMEERRKMKEELCNSKSEEEKCKMVTESLASALHKVSAKSREAEEKLRVFESEKTDQIEHLKKVVNSTKDGQYIMLLETQQRILTVENLIQQSELEFLTWKSEWAKTEAWVQRLENSLAEAEEQCGRVKGELTASESEVVFLKKALAEAEAERIGMSQCIMEKERDVSRINEEKQELRRGEMVYAEKVAELTQRLEEALVNDDGREKTITMENTESDSEYDLLQKVGDFPKENGHRTEENDPVIVCSNSGLDVGEEERASGSEETELSENPKGKIENVGGDDETEKNGDFLMLESCRIGEDEASEVQESREDVKKSSLGGRESCDSENGEGLGRQSTAKKTALLARFGSILKKKSSSNSSSNWR